MESGSLPEIEEINFTSSDNKSPIVNCDPPRGQQKWVIVTTSLYNTWLLWRFAVRKTDPCRSKAVPEQNYMNERHGSGE
jgi:hypothetical protein